MGYLPEYRNEYVGLIQRLFIERREVRWLPFFIGQKEIVKLFCPKHSLQCTVIVGFKDSELHVLSVTRFNTFYNFIGFAKRNRPVFFSMRHPNWNC